MYFPFQEAVTRAELLTALAYVIVMCCNISFASRARTLCNALNNDIQYVLDYR